MFISKLTYLFPKIIHRLKQPYLVVVFMPWKSELKHLNWTNKNGNLAFKHFFPRNKGKYWLRTFCKANIDQEKTNSRTFVSSNCVDLFGTLPSMMFSDLRYYDLKFPQCFFHFDFQTRNDLFKFKLLKGPTH